MTEATVQPDEQVEVQVDNDTVAVLGPGGNVLQTLGKGQAHVFARAIRRSGGVATGERGRDRTVAAGAATAVGIGTGAWIAIGATATGAVLVTQPGS